MLEEKRAALTKLLMQLMDERMMREKELRKRLVSTGFVSLKDIVIMIWCLYIHLI